MNQECFCGYVCAGDQLPAPHFRYLVAVAGGPLQYVAFIASPHYGLRHQPVWIMEDGQERVIEPSDRYQRVSE